MNKKYKLFNTPCYKLQWKLKLIKLACYITKKSYLCEMRGNMDTTLLCKTQNFMVCSIRTFNPCDIMNFFLGDKWCRNSIVLNDIIFGV